MVRMRWQIVHKIVRMRSKDGKTRHGDVNQNGAGAKKEPGRGMVKMGLAGMRATQK